MSLGKRAKRIRHTLAVEQKNRCCYCKRVFGAKGTELAATIEHRKAKMDGGGNQRENLAAACQHCNQHRGKQMNASRQAKRRAEAKRSVDHAIA